MYNNFDFNREQNNKGNSKAFLWILIVLLVISIIITVMLELKEPTNPTAHKATSVELLDGNLNIVKTIEGVSRAKIEDGDLYYIKNGKTYQLHSDYNYIIITD